MKKYEIHEVICVDRCYTCRACSLRSLSRQSTVEREWYCEKTNKVICNGVLSLMTGTYIKKPIIHTKGWFPEWCPLEDWSET